MSNLFRLKSVMTGVILIVISALFAACDIGLGPMVNTEIPVISIPKDGKEPGTSLQGSDNRIELNVEQPFGLETVFMVIWYDCSINGPCEASCDEVCAVNHPCLPPCAYQQELGAVWDQAKGMWKRNVPAKYDSVKKVWYVDLDTEGMADGTIRTQVTAIDVSGKETTTTEIIYNIKNLPPQIELTVPKIKGAQFDDAKLNDLLIDNPIFTGNYLFGIATDSYGIRNGYPQIRLWPDPNNEFYKGQVALNSNGEPFETDTKWGQWRTVLNAKDEPVSVTGSNAEMLKAAQFRWPLDAFNGNNRGDPLQAGDYRVQIKTMDGFGIENVYPDRSDNKAAVKQNPKYMIIRLIASDNPIIRFVASHRDTHWTGNNTIISVPLQETSPDDVRMPFPQYYNGAVDFGEELIARMQITTGNHPLKVYAKITSDDNAGFHDDPANDELYRENVIAVPESGSYFIRISKAKIQSTGMLGKTNISGDVMLHVRAIDSEGNESVASRPLIIDEVFPHIEFIEPQGMGTLANCDCLIPCDHPKVPQLTSTVIIRGSAQDNQLVDSLYYALGKKEAENVNLGLTWDNNAGWVNTGLGTSDGAIKKHPYFPNDISSEWTGSLLSWSWRFENIADFCGYNASAAIKEYFIDPYPGNNLWKLPVKFKVIDKAKNVTIIDALIILDPDADIPTVQINSHEPGQIVGGKINISGTATDNEWINDVEIRVRKVNGASFEPVAPYNGNFMPILPVSTMRSSTVSWSHDLNTTNNWIGEYQIDVRARDSYIASKGEKKDVRPGNTDDPDPSKRPADVKSIRLVFDAGVPTIDITIIHGSYNDYMAANSAGKTQMEDPFKPGVSATVKGKITIKVDIVDDKQVSSLKTRYWPATTNNANNDWGMNYLQPAFSGTKQIFGGDEQLNIVNVSSGSRYTMYFEVDTTKRGYVLGVPVPLYPDDIIYSVDIEALDNTTPVNYRTQATITLIPDNAPPVIQFIEPLQNPSQTPSVTSTVIIRGSVTDNQRVSQMWYALGTKAVSDVSCKSHSNIGCPNCVNGSLPNAPEWIEWVGTNGQPRTNHPETSGTIRSRWSGSLASWEWRFENIADVLQTTLSGKYVNAYPSGVNLWSLPIVFKVTDNAKNVLIVPITLIVDPDKDQPFVYVSSHTNEQVVGGPIRVSGTAEDNEMIESVEYRIKMQSDANCDTNNEPSVYYAGSETQWIKAHIPSHDSHNYTSTVSWYIDINEGSMALNPPVGKNIRRVLLEFRAWDSSIFSNPPVRKERAGPLQSIMLQFDSSVPVITDFRIFNNLPQSLNESDLIAPAGGTAYIDGTTKIRDKLTMRLTVRDETQIDSIKLTSGNTTIDLFTTSDVSMTQRNDVNPWKYRLPKQAGANPPDEYYVFIPMNTVALSAIGAAGRTMFGSGFPNLGDSFNLTVEAQDNTTPVPYVTQKAFAIEVDNRYPMARYTGDTFARGNKFLIRGEVWDTGAGVRTQGVERVVVYLSRGGQIINLHGASVNQPITTTPILTQHAMVGQDGDSNIITTFGSVQTLPFYPDTVVSGNVRSTDEAIVIDGAHPAWSDTLNTSKNFDGSSLINWSVEYDTTKLTDGKYQLNYVAFDYAGNASHYENEIYIANNNPQITSILLGCDIDSSGTVTGVTSAGVIDQNAVRKEYKEFEDITNSLLKTNFRIRNNSFSLRLNVSSPKNYFNGDKLSYDIYYAVPDNTETRVINKGSVYTIKDVGIASEIGWVNYGVFGTPEEGYTFIATASGTLPSTRPNGQASTASVTGYTTTIAAANTAARIRNDIPSLSLTATAAHEISFTASAFTGTNTIPDSAPKTGGVIQTNNQRHFIVRVYDNTVSSASDQDQLSFVTVIAVDIDNTDARPPQLNNAAFGSRYPNNENHEAKNIQTLNITDADGFLAESEYNRNIVTGLRSGSNVTERKGYVQYAGANHAGVGRNADVSGKVIFTGRAWDNNRVGRITVQINKTGNALSTETTIGQWRQAGGIGALRPVIVSSDEQTVANMTSDSSEAAWGFDADEQHLTLDYGHTVNWRFAWDSSSIANQEGVTFTFKVYDAETGTGNTPYSDTITVNVVPYITEIKTQLSGAMSGNPSTFNRSATGWYPVRDGSNAETITIKGFNFFNGSGTYAAPTIYVGGTAADTSAADRSKALSGGVSLTGTVGTDGSAEEKYRQKTQVKVSLNVADLMSGALVVRADGWNSINNSNSTNAAASYHKEPNRANNNNLTDDRGLYVWNTGYLLNQKTAQYPIMQMNRSGHRAIVFSDYLNRSTASTNDPSQLHLTVNNQTVPNEGNATNLGLLPNGTIIERTTNRYINTGLALDESNNWYAGASNITSGVSNNNNVSTYFAFHARGASTAGYAASSVNKRRILSLLASQNNMDTNRVRFPRFAAQTTSGVTRVLASYYDSHGSSDGRVVLHYGLVGNSITNGSNTERTTSSGGVGGQLVEPSNWGNTNTAGVLYTDQQQVVASNSTTYRGSNYIAIGLLANGLPVVAWYDNAGQRLVISYGGNTTTANTRPLNGTALTTTIGDTTSIVNTQTGALDTANSWQGNAAVVQNYAGTHVDMAVDKANNVHLAYYDVFNGGLYYAFIPPTNGTNTNSRPNTGAIRTVKVDTYLSAGTKVMINVREQNTGNHVPYITYFHESFNETTHSIRVAWPRHTINSTNNPQAGSNDLDRLTGNWEVMSVPAETVPLKDYYICNGVPESDATWSGSKPSSSTLDYGTTTAGSRLSRSILVGYMTTNWYEGAILKREIW